MKSDDLEAKMRRGEFFHGTRVPDGMYAVVRVDGHSFSRLTERLCEKPFDAKFQLSMTEAAKEVFAVMHGAYVHSQSDEISVLLPHNFDLFDREVEKLITLSASAASGVLSVRLGEPVRFDGRIWIGARKADVVDYFRWRQADATRAGLNGWVYWTLRKEGKSVAQATKAMIGMNGSKKNEFLFERGVNFNEVPAWQRRGSAVYWEVVEKLGRNPKTGQTTPVKRRRIVADNDLPMKEEYGRFVRQFLKEEE